MPKKILILIVAYNAEQHIENVLDRIPRNLLKQGRFVAEILVIDDASSDGTVARCHTYTQRHDIPILVFRNPVNQGYGGNQKVGYTYAMENGFDVVVLLHGDGQYPPEMIEQMVEPIATGDADAVFGSRMMVKRNALKGGMPVYKFIGNIVLTKLQNFLIGAKLTEFHSGFRAYRVSALAAVPLSFNSNDFDFDTDIIIQLVDTRSRICEIPIPTHYGDEICNVNGVKYALQILHSTLLSRVQKYGIYYTRRFDYTLGQPHYDDKGNFDSTHSFAVDLIPHGSVVLDIGCFGGHVGKRLIEEKGCVLYGIDQFIGDYAREHYAGVRQCNLDDGSFTLPEGMRCVDYVLVMDVIEHLICPERFLEDMRTVLAPFQPRFIMTIGNVGFIIQRLSLLFGQFNYGKRGILDMTHKRLFTFRSFRNLLQEEGFSIGQVRGMPVPIPFIIHNRFLATLLLKINNLLIRISRGLFAYQIATVVEAKPTLGMLLKDAKEGGDISGNTKKAS